MRQLLMILAFLSPAIVPAQEEHNHPIPEKLGAVSFPTSCNPATQREFNRAVALLHSFTYKPAEEAFRSVAEHDPHCAIAHWGIAMTHFHQLWDLPPSPADTSVHPEPRLIVSRAHMQKNARMFFGLISKIPLVPHRPLVVQKRRPLRIPVAGNL